MRARSVVPTVLIALASCLILLTAVAGAHEMDADEHRAEDSVSLSPAQEQSLDAATLARTASDAARAASSLAGPPEQTGRWGPLVDWPVVAIHTALMPDGKVLAYDSVDFEHSDTHDHTRATLWDPATGAHTAAWVIGHNIFCSGLAHLPDGSIFTAGGNIPGPPLGFNGIVQTYTFDAATHSWKMGPDMAAPRWYPSVTGMANGEMLITDGTLDGAPNGAEKADTPELRTTAGTLRSLPGATIDLPLYPWLDVAPDGRAFYSGPDPTLRSLSTAGAGSWQTFSQRDTVMRDYGSHAMFDVGKILVAGGGNSLTSANVININGPAPTVAPTGSMANGRRQHTLTVLADGTVLATGGNSSGVTLADLDNGVYEAELWNPQTGQWRGLDSMRETRQYHSTALLLPDGRVLSAGGGICGDCNNYLAKNAEVFSPPYLFRKDGSGQLAPRPSIAPAASRVNYGAPLDMASAEAASIRKLALVRLGAVTHSVNMDQRYVPLSFTAGSGILSATTPPNPNIAPPGVYMLFATDANGVPSVAKMITLAGDAPPAPRLKAKTCRVPSLKRKTRTGAKKSLSKAGCRLGSTKKRHLKRFTKKARKNRVRSQSIKAKSVVPAGTKVSITINVKKTGKKH